MIRDGRVTIPNTKDWPRRTILRGVGTSLRIAPGDRLDRSTSIDVRGSASGHETPPRTAHVFERPVFERHCFERHSFERYSFERYSDRLCSRSR